MILFKLFSFFIKLLIDCLVFGGILFGLYFSLGVKDQKALGNDTGIEGTAYYAWMTAKENLVQPGLDSVCSWNDDQRANR